MATKKKKKTAVVFAAEQLKTSAASVDYITQTKARGTIVDKLLTTTKYRGEPAGDVINRDIDTSPYNPNKAWHRFIYDISTPERGKRKRIDFYEEFDIHDFDIFTTPPFTSPFNIESKVALEASILSHGLVLRTSKDPAVGVRWKQNFRQI